MPRPADLCREPGGSLPAARGDRRGRKIGVVVVDHVEGVIAAIARALDALDDVEERRAVIALRRKHAAVARRLDEVVEIPQIVGELHEKDALAGYGVETVAGSTAREHV